MASRFLQVDQDEEEEEQVPVVEQKVVPKKEVGKKKNKKGGENKKNDDDDILDQMLQGKQQEVVNVDDEASKQAEEKKKKKEEKKKRQEQNKDAPKPQQQQQKQDDKKPMNAAAQRALEIKKAKEEELRRINEEQERFQREEDERIRKIEEEERLRAEELERRRIAKEQQVQALKDAGLYKTKKQLREEKLQEERRKEFLKLYGKDKIDDAEKDQITDHSNVVKKTKRKNPHQQQQQQQQNQPEQKEEVKKETIQDEPQRQAEAQIEHKQPQQQIEQNQPQQQQPQEHQEKLEQKKQQEQKQQKQPSPKKSPIKEQKLPSKKQSEEVDDWEALAADDTTQQVQIIQQEVKKVNQQQDQVQQKTIHAAIKPTNHKLNNIYDQYLPTGDLRSPICCILGHVDTGKTTLLDKIRNTNVQEGEAGGITQQIGATFFPAKKLKEELAKTASFYTVDCCIPGLLIIDTPGHESFSNLRTRGSSLCDLAILVIDLMHGLEKQTLESLELLRMRKTPFIIALNKIDRCVEWKKKKNESSYQQLKNQNRNCRDDYDSKKQQVFTQLAEKGFNVALYWENDDPKNYVSVVPTSGVTGEGIPDLLSVIVKYTSVYLKKKISLKEQFNCTVMEKKVLEGHGTTVDILLVDGILKKDDKIALAGFTGPIITKVKAILTPHPMKEMRVKGEYISHDIMYASMGIKLSALNLEEAMAGSQMYLANTPQELETAVQLINHDMESVKQYIKLQNQGVGVAASTLGSLEALLQFLNNNNIPVSYVSVGPVSKDDVMKALKNVLLEDPARRKKEYACMLVFDIKVLPDAVKFAEENQIKIFEADIIYNLFDKFMDFVSKIKEERKLKEAQDAIFPCVLKPVKFFNTKEPLIMGVDVVQGVLKQGTPLCIFDEGKTKIGIVETIELNKKSIKEARAINGSVAIRLNGSSHITAGRQITMDDKFVSVINRRAIDILKEHFRNELTLDDWELVKQLKEFLQIP